MAAKVTYSEPLKVGIPVSKIHTAIVLIINHNFRQCVTRHVTLSHHPSKHDANYFFRVVFAHRCFMSNAIKSTNVVTVAVIRRVERTGVDIRTEAIVVHIVLEVVRA